MNNNKKILKLLIRFLFYGHFVFWSFIAGDIIRIGNTGYLLPDNEAYLILSEYSTSLFSGKEESENLSHYPVSWLITSGINFFRLIGNHQSINLGRLLIPNINYSILDLPRPPPFLFSPYT